MRLGKIGCAPMMKKWTARDYVQDGLVAMWDGIENAGWGVHDPNAVGWKDLSPNGYSLEQIGSPIISIGSGWYDLNCYSSSFLRRMGTTIPAITAECVFSVASKQYTVLTCPRGGYQSPFIVFSICDWNMLIPLAYSGKSIKGIPISVGIPNATTVIHGGDRNSTGFLNGVSSNESFTSSSDLGWQYNYTSYPTVGYASSMGGRTGFIGRVFAIRYYSRNLTEAEIAANYKIDKIRFNLP